MSKQRDRKEVVSFAGHQGNQRSPTTKYNQVHPPKRNQSHVDCNVLMNTQRSGSLWQHFEFLENAEQCPIAPLTQAHWRNCPTNLPMPSNSDIVPDKVVQINSEVYFSLDNTFVCITIALKSFLLGNLNYSMLTTTTPFSDLILKLGLG